MFYHGTVVAYNPATERHTVQYDDGDREDLVSRLHQELQFEPPLGSPAPVLAWQAWEMLPWWAGMRRSLQCSAYS